MGYLCDLIKLTISFYKFKIQLPTSCICKNYEHFMKSTTLFLVLVFISITNISGQQKLTKEQILKYWLKSEKPLTNDILINTRFDNNLDHKINKFIDSIKNKNIDSIIVYSSAYPGYDVNSKCKSGFFPIYTYIIWKIFGETKIQKIEGNCNFNVAQLNSTEMFDFYETNHMRLKGEFFMPVILGGQKDKKKQTVSYSFTSIDHEPSYCIFYSIDANHRTLKFSESEIQDKKSLFYEHNQKLVAIEWWKIIKKYTTDTKH